MSELHRFIFDGLPVRGMVVRLTDAWQEVLKRRAANTETGAYPAAVTQVLGQMAAAGVLLQGNIKFNGALVLQVFGDGPVKVSVVEVQSDLALRAMATVQGEVSAGADLATLFNAHGQGRCAITLDPQDRQPGQQPYQGVVPLNDADGAPLHELADVIEQYMRQSEQLDTTLVLAADDQVAAGILIQRLPLEGAGNLAGQGASSLLDANEDYERIRILTRSLKPEELLGLPVADVLHRLFWQEPLQRFEPLLGDGRSRGPRFACRCNRDRVSQMIRNLGREEADSIIADMGAIAVGCEFCGQQYHYDAVDAAQLFTDASRQPAVSSDHQ